MSRKVLQAAFSHVRPARRGAWTRQAGYGHLRPSHPSRQARRQVRGSSHLTTWFFCWQPVCVEILNCNHPYLFIIRRCSPSTLPKLPPTLVSPPLDRSTSVPSRSSRIIRPLKCVSGSPTLKGSWARSTERGRFTLMPVNSATRESTQRSGPNGTPVSPSCEEYDKRHPARIQTDEQCCPIYSIHLTVVSLDIP